jgi:hypothetical protein
MSTAPFPPVADRGVKGVPRYRAPTIASSARTRVPSDSGVKPLGAQLTPSNPPVRRRRVQTPHPSSQPRVVSSSSDGSDGGPRFRGHTRASANRSRQASGSSVHAGGSMRTPAQSVSRPEPPPCPVTRPPPTSTAKAPLVNHLEAMAATFRASQQARVGPPASAPTATDSSLGLSGHLAGMAAAFERQARANNPSKSTTLPSFQRPTAASARRSAPSGSVPKPILKQPPEGHRCSKTVERVRRAAQRVKFAVSSAKQRLVGLRKPRVDNGPIEDNRPRVVDFRDFNVDEFEPYLVRGEDAWQDGECSGHRRLHDFVENVYLRCSRQ